MGTPVPASARLSRRARAVGHLAMLVAITLAPLASARAESGATPPAPPELLIGELRLPLAPQPALAPEERVARAARRPAPPAAAPAPPPEITVYTVEPGDSVRDIAAQFQIDVLTVLGANPEVAERPDLLFPGEQLTILPTPGILVTAGEGQTLADLAAEFGVDLAAVAAYNGLAGADPLPAGARLVLPGVRPELGEQQAAALPATGPLPGPGFRPLWPVQGDITTYFGEIGPTSPRGHSGVDIAAPLGAPIYAAESGAVRTVGRAGDYGLLVILAHAGYQTWYGHLSAFDVGVGEWVQRGQLIGRVGSTGYSTGPHLHFEVRENGELRNPLNYLP